MNITLLTTSFPRNSGDAAGRFIYEYAEHLARRGSAIQVLAPHGPGIPDAPLSTHFKVTHFRYFIATRLESLAYGGGIPSRLKENPLRVFLLPFFMLSFFVSALRLARRSDALHAFWTPAALVALATRPFLKVPVVITLWGSDLLFTRIPLFSGFLRACLRKADAIVCESTHFKEALTAFGLPEDKITVIANGIDLKRFKPRDRATARRELGLKEDGFIYLSVGSCSPAKGHRHLIEAMPRILEQVPGARFIVVGDGELRPSLEAAARTLNVAGHITFAGGQDPGDIPRWMNAADALIHPSLREGTPNAVLEAMASGLPVITTPVGGLADMIVDRENGVLVSAGSAAELADGALLVATNESLRRLLGQNARQWVVNGFDGWDEQARQVAELYAAVLGGNSRNTRAAKSAAVEDRP